MTDWTTAEVHEYLGRNYVSISWLAAQTGLAVDVIESLIRHGCIPGPSYEILEVTEIYAYSDEKPYELARKSGARHFSPYVAAWIERVKPLLNDGSHQDLSLGLKAQFRREYLDGLIAHGAREMNYKDLFCGDGSLREREFDEHFADTYLHWLKGTWGICVIRSDSFERFAKKRLAVERLVRLTADGTKSSFDRDEAAAVKEAIAAYEAIVLPFSPHDHRESSRWRLVDNVLPRLTG